MTREEAIKHIENIIPYVGENVKESLNMAIKILEQEPCENVVSRKVVLHELGVLWNSSGDKDYCMETLRDFVVESPSVTPTQRWIPVSERLPEESITVIGTTKFDDIYKTELYDDCGEKKWYANGDFDVPIVAWMPLPKPYRAEEEKKQC